LSRQGRGSLAGSGKDNSRRVRRRDLRHSRDTTRGRRSRSQAADRWPSEIPHRAFRHRDPSPGAWILGRHFRRIGDPGQVLVSTRPPGGCSHPRANDRCYLREKQQRSARYRVPCNSGAPAVISRTRGALPRSCTQASVAELRRQTLTPDEQAESEPPGDSCPLRPAIAVVRVRPGKCARTSSLAGVRSPRRRRPQARETASFAAGDRRTDRAGRDRGAEALHAAVWDTAARR
jgi:hypothetical protein